MQAFCAGIYLGFHKFQANQGYTATQKPEGKEREEARERKREGEGEEGWRVSISSVLSFTKIKIFSKRLLCSLTLRRLKMNSSSQH